MNVPGILNALTALTAANGSKAPLPNANRAQPAASFRQALSQEVAQRQPPPPPAAAQHGSRPHEAAKAPPGAKPHATDKTRSAETAPANEAAQAPTDAPPTATAAQASEAKSEDKPVVEDSAASLADIPGAPQAALMMQLMTPTPVAATMAETAVATDAAAIASGKEVASQGPLDLRERALPGKETAASATATSSQAATPDPSALPGMHAAFGKTMNDAASAQAAQALTAAQTEAPTAAPAALAALQAAVQAVHTPAVPVDKLTPPVGTPAWDQALGQKIVWMAHGGEQSATLTMNPPDLGPMQVVLSVTNNQATVDFMAAQPEVRQALEAALPRLREMMSESGVQLGQANVSAGGQQQFAGFGGQNKGSGARGGDGLTIDDTAPQLRQGVVRMARDGAVDTFA